MISGGFEAQPTLPMPSAVIDLADDEEVKEDVDYDVETEYHPNSKRRLAVGDCIAPIDPQSLGDTGLKKYRKDAPPDGAKGKRDCSWAPLESKVLYESIVAKKPWKRFRNVPFFIPPSLSSNEVEQFHFLFPGFSDIKNRTLDNMVYKLGHPLSSDSRNNDLAIKKYMNKTVKPLMRYPTPVQADVWWRILFRMLPVNSRFFFLQDTNPSIIECSFLFVKPVWNWHQAAWRPFGIPFTWNTIINLDEFAVSEEWVSHFSVIRRLWVLLVSSLLRDFWIHRNRTKFEGKTVPYIQAVKEVSLVSWTANIRRMLRDPTMDSDEAMQVSEIVEKLKSHTNYTWF
ncbi:hypothetical protein AC1031_014777 [Aphanomyces cochlioides]|nr:hypothetical protein AC1031_014777 [Aphanomyces cochlioides]